MSGPVPTGRAVLTHHFGATAELWPTLANYVDAAEDYEFAVEL